MKVAFLVPARNKERHVRRCVESVLSQTYPCEILLSDQGSTDDTASILKKLAQSYRGPHTVRLLKCPHLNYRGMPGLNVHMNWLMDQSDADVFIMTSADDITSPHRVKATMRVYQELGPSMVITGQLVANEKTLAYEGQNARPSQSGWVTSEEMLRDSVGGSTTQSWTRAFFDKVKPLPGIPGLDVFLPFLAIQDKGCYYLHENLHTYIKYADPDNTGLEGAWRAGDDTKKTQLEELMHFQGTTTLYSILACMQRNGWMDETAQAAVYAQIMDRAASWCHIRQNMALARIDPIPFKC